MAKEKSIKELEDLPGIGPTTAEKLRASGIDNLDKVAVMTPNELNELSGVSVEAAKKAIQAAKESTTVTYETGNAVYDRRKEIGKISTGSSELDELIGGGIEAGAITETYGQIRKREIADRLPAQRECPAAKRQGRHGGHNAFC